MDDAAWFADKSHADEDMESSSRGQATEGSGNADESGKSQQPYACLLPSVFF